jgi:hypothetical protein
LDPNGRLADRLLDIVLAVVSKRAMWVGTKFGCFGQGELELSRDRMMIEMQCRWIFRVSIEAFGGPSVRVFG